MECPKCNGLNSMDAKFCTSCGASIKEPPENESPNDKRIGLSRLIARTLVIASAISIPFIIVGEWVPVAIVVTGFLFASFNPSVRREVSMMTSKKKNEKDK